MKSVYIKTFNSEPHRLHNLIYFAKQCNIQFPEDLFDLVYTLNGMSVPTRYPDELRGMLKIYSKKKTREIVSKSGEVLRWIRENS